MGPITVLPGQCLLFPDFLAPSDGYTLFEVLQKSVEWETHSVRLFGRTHRCPRLIAWYGDPGARYRYSGVTHQPRPWLEELRALRLEIQRTLGSPFNSVLLNYYRDGNDSMGMHSDDEKELGHIPVIASVSLGDARRFTFQPRGNNCEPGVKLDLPHGSLLVMQANCQQEWKHGVPKTRKAVGERINLTFRNILRQAESALPAGPE